jgi:phospholipid/cholesterol/gamma-HCH transport system substrate-binding protein
LVITGQYARARQGNDMFKGNPSLAVGVFVSVALIALASFAMWLAGTKGNEPMAEYSVLFERDISGLSLGGPVYYMGVGVGQVSSMNLLPGDPVKVRVDIRILASTPIDQGTYASLTSQGITGVNVINIAAEPGQHPPLVHSEDDEHHPLIPVRQTGLSAMLAQAPDTISKLNAALDQANLLLGPENRAAISQFLTNVESLSTALAEDRAAWAALPDDMQNLLVDAQSLVRELNGTVAQLRPELSATLEHTRQTAANAEQLSARLDELISANEAEFDHFIENGLGQTPEMIYDLRSSLRDLQKLLRQLQNDPSQLIHRPQNDALEVNP